MNEEAIKALYESISGDYEVGTIDEFKIYLSDETKRAKFFEQVIKPEYDVESLEQFETVYGLKKKVDSTLETEDTDGTTEVPGEITLSEFSEDLFDYDSILDSTEENALPKVESLLADKGYSVEETGVGNALLITDNISGESTEIDLKPIFGKDKQIKKLRDILETPTDARRSVMSTLNLKDYKKSGSYEGGRNAYVSSLQDQFPGFNFETLSESGQLKISKGDSEVVINTKEGYDDAYQFSEINKFINNNLSDDEVSQVSADFEKKIYDQTISDLNKIKDEVDISVESVKGEFMSGKYFGGLFDFLEEKGIDTSSIPEQEKQRLIRGVKNTGGVSPVSGAPITVQFNNEDVVKNLDTYFSDNPEVQAAVDFYNTTNTTEKRNQAIERATKLKIENYYENSPNRSKVKNIVLKEFGKLTEQESDIYANVKLAQNELKGMTESVKSDIKALSEKNPGVSFSIEEVDGKLSVVTSDKNVDVSDLEKKIADSLVTYDDLLKKSKTDLEKVTSKISDTKEYRDASKRNYNLIDQAYADFKSAVTNMAASGGIIAGLVKETVGDIIGSDTLEAQGATEVLLSRGAMAESRENVDKYFETKRTYNEAFKEGTTGAFSVRTFAEQAPNIALAVGTSGAGSAMGLSEAAVSTLIASQFGLTSSGGKYDELTTRQEASALAKKGLEELESIKGEIPEEEYFKQKYELERAIKDGDISATDKALSVIGTGLVEGIVTRYIGTVPNSVKVLKDLKGPSKFMDDILSSNYRAAGKAVKEFGKRTGGEIIEEGSIEALNQINDYLTIGDDMDFSQLDDVAVTSIITSGSMNAPSVAYSGIVSQINTNRYKSKINSITGAIDSFKKILQEPGLTQSQRSSVHDNISKLVSSAADVTSNMEADAMLLGSDNIKELLTLSGVKKSLLDKAGVMPDDSYDIANAKIDNYLGGLNKKDKKDFSDKLKFVSDRQNEIVGSIDYTKAIEKTFGNKGVEIEKTLDPDLSSQEKYVEVYKQIRTEINEDAKKEYDAIQKQETREVPDAEPAEGVQEVETEVRVTPEQETEVNPPTKPETKRFQDDNVVLKEEKFTITDDDGSRQEITIKTNLDGSLNKAETLSFDENGNQVGETKLKIADNDIVVRDGLTAEEILTKGLFEGQVIEKTSERSGNEINNPKKTAQLTTEQKQKLGIETKKDESEQTVSEIDEVTVTEEKVVPAGKRLFNNPNPETTEISKKYKKERNNETPEGEPITSIDTENSRDIADVYESLEDSPNDPKVQEAYSLMADETAAQHQEIINAGYEVEIWNGEGEPYANAQEMIDDVRDNKHMWIFSTEAGFGDTAITEEQRQQNKLLQDSGFKDKNGNTLLYNDLFRFVHDFFGHTERGNGFGPVGEENAWDVHSRMYTPLARRAMTTETRGQNSWVNFGPQMRNDKGELIKKGEEGYLIPKERAFAPQKMALMPEKYSVIDSDSKKKSPSAKKILGIKPKKITVNEYAALKDQIRLESRAAREAQKDLNTKRKELAATIKDLAKKGVITANQSTVLINRVSSVNLNNSNAVDNLIKYMDKVYSNAEYANNILRSNKKRNVAKKNIKTKIGSAGNTFQSLKKLFSIDAKLIPESVLDTYFDIVEQFGASKSVLDLDSISLVNQKVKTILDAIDQEVSEIPRLQLAYNSYEDKVTVDGKVSFGDTLKKMVDDGYIEKEDADLIKKYKKDIIPTEEKTKEETGPIDYEFKQNNVEDKLESKAAKRFIDLVKNNKEAIEQLTDKDRLNIQSVIDNIAAGFMPSYANSLSNEIESIIAKDKVLPRLKRGSKLIIDKLIGTSKALFGDKRATEYQIRQNPLSDIDNVLGNSNRTDVYDNIFGKAAKSFASLQTDVDIISEKLQEAENLINKQFFKKNDRAKSKYKIMSYMLQREYDSNKDNKKVFSAVDAINEIIKVHDAGKESTYTDKDIEILESIKESFTVDGEISSKKIMDSLSTREKKAINIMDDVNKSLAEKALYTASIIRGVRPDMIDNYVHHSVAMTDQKAMDSVSEKYNQFKTFSTKAGTLVERTPGVKALNFDPIYSSMSGAKSTLLDYHMTNPAKTIFKTLNKIQKDIIDNKDSTKKEKEVAASLVNAFDTTMQVAFESNYTNKGLNLGGNLKSLGYKALLASVPRAFAEFGSNLSYALLANPAQFTNAISNYRSLIMSTEGRDIMSTLKSEQTGKLYSKKVTGKTADVGLFAEDDSIKKAGAVNDVLDVTRSILEKGKVVPKTVDYIADKLISTPDKAISRPIWFGSLSTEFKKITGVDIDMEAIKNEDQKYLEENKEALDKATKFADREVTRAATSINPFNGILKNKINPKDSSSLKLLKELNGFMSNFIIYEYTTARAGVISLMNEGEISKKKGAALLLGTTARMSLYTVLYQALSHAFDSVVKAVTGIGGDDEDEDYSMMATRQILGSVMSTVFGKNLGNIAKIPINMGIEYLNENYLSDLREGRDYDPFKDGMTFGLLSMDEVKNKPIPEIMLTKLSGAYSPFFKTLIRSGKLYQKINNEKYKDETKQKAMDELTGRMLLEALGNAGLIPLYKDVRRIILSDLFKETKKVRKINRFF